MRECEPIGEHVILSIFVIFFLVHIPSFFVLLCVQCFATKPRFITVIAIFPPSPPPPPEYYDSFISIEM